MSIFFRLDGFSGSISPTIQNLALIPILLRYLAADTNSKIPL